MSNMTSLETSLVASVGAEPTLVKSKLWFELVEVEVLLCASVFNSGITKSTFDNLGISTGANPFSPCSLSSGLKK